MFCPNCKKSSDIKYKPFCSKRCSQMDLYSWLKEEYSIPVVELDDIDEKDMEDMLSLSLEESNKVSKL